jgi:hypothetical protein
MIFSIQYFCIVPFSLNNYIISTKIRSGQPKSSSCLLFCRPSFIIIIIIIFCHYPVTNIRKTFVTRPCTDTASRTPEQTLRVINQKKKKKKREKEKNAVSRFIFSFHSFPSSIMPVAVTLLSPAPPVATRHPNTGNN